jgi:DASS family divalent anion:Na+ symporter
VLLATARVSNVPIMIEAAESTTLAQPALNKAASRPNPHFVKLVLLFALYVFIAYVVPRPSSIQPNSWRIFAVFVTTIAALIVQPIPAAASVLIGMTMLIVAGGMPVTEALAGFGNPSVWMLFGAMLMARVLIDTGLSRRLALHFVARFGGSSLGVVYSLSLTDISLAGGVPSIAARSGGIILPIARSIGQLYRSSAGETAPLLGTFLMAALYQASVVTCAMFLTGQAGNVLAAAMASQVGVTVTWSSWFVAALVPGAISAVVIPYLVYRILPPVIKVTPEAPAFARAELERMGPLTRPEITAGSVILAMCLMWATGSWTDISATAVALSGIAILLVTKVLLWESAIRDHSVLDVVIWYGGLVTMGETLNKTGVPAVFTAWVGGWFTGLPWLPVLIATLLIYFYSHYGFPTVTVHVLAMFSAFVGLLVSLNAPAPLVVYSFACMSALPAGLTHYGTTTAPMFIEGYVSVGDWWKVGLAASAVNLAIWLTAGFLWWRLLGFW